MRRRRFLAAVLAGTSTALAGCSGAPGGSPTEPAETVTPAPVPEDAAGTTEGGPSIEGWPFRMTSPGDLLAIQRATLENRSVTVSVRRTVRSPSETREDRRTAVIAADRNRYHTRSVRPGGVPDRYVWSDGETLVLRHLENGTVVEHAEFGPEERHELRALDPLAVAEPSLSMAFELATEVRAHRRGGYRTTMLIDLEASVLLATGAVRDVESPTLALTIQPDGFVDAYRVRFDAIRSDEPVRVEREVRFDDVGDTDVPPIPAEGRDATPTPRDDEP